MRAEKPQRPWKEAAGSRHEPGLVRQTATATAEPIGPQTQALMEEVLRRENLLMHAAVNNRLLASWGLLNLLTHLWTLQRGT